MQQHKWVELDKSALIWNAQQYASVVGSYAKICMVVKGNAYGHGLGSIVSIVECVKEISYLGAFSLSEALSIRSKGSTKPVIVLGDMTDACLYEAAHKDIHFVVDTFENLLLLNDVGRQTNYVFFVHLKVETGLNRFGMHAKELQKVKEELKNLAFISVVGMTTHFAEKGKIGSAFTYAQCAVFQKIIAPFGELPFIHKTTTIDSLMDAAKDCSLVRIGLGLYGYAQNPSIEAIIKESHPSFLLKSVLTWKARIIRIKRITAGETVGYDRTFVATKDMNIGIIPAGYVDGYSGAFAQVRTVYWRDIPLLVIGSIAMNCFVIDLQNAPDLQLYDEVVLLDKRIASLMFAHNPEQNMRVVYAGINAALPRIIVDSSCVQQDKGAIDCSAVL